MGFTATYSSGNERQKNRPAAKDTSSGLNYYGYRYYDPVTGRWPSRDPIGEILGLEEYQLEEGPNLLAFAKNDSVNRSDYLGLVSSLPGGVAGAAAAGWSAAEIAEVFGVALRVAQVAVAAAAAEIACQVLRDAVKDAKKALEGVAGCKGNDDCDTLKMKAPLWFALSNSRYSLNTQCPLESATAQTNHVKMQEDNYRAWETCKKLIAKKCCE